MNKTTTAIGVISTKGGIGKTSLTANLGAFLAEHWDYKVLLIDSDFQQSLSSYYNLVKKSEFGLKQAITQGVYPNNCISETTIKNLHLIQSDDPNQELVTWLRASSSHVYYMNAMIASIKTKGVYDFIIIDSQGAKGIMQESVILSVDYLLAPTTPEFLSAQEFLRGTVAMVNNLQLPKGVPGYRELPKILGLINRLDRTSDAKIVVELLREHFTDNSQVSFFNTVIYQRAAFNKSAGLKIPVHQFEKKRYGQTVSAFEIMEALATEFLTNIQHTDLHYNEVAQHDCQ